MKQQLADALSAEHAAIFGYGVVGAHLSGALVTAARQAEETHRFRRDELLVRLGDGAPPAAPAYGLPFPVTGAAAALRLAVLIEERCAAAWQATLGATAGEQRRTGLAALTDCAQRAVGWRTAAKITPTLVPFPGRS